MSLEENSDQLLLSTLEAEKDRRHTTNRLAYYRPYPKQLSWHNAGAKHRERLMCAGNQLGKTLAGGFEVSGEVLRDTVQRVLLGRAGAIGTGTIPKDAILETVTARGIADLSARSGFSTSLAACL